MDYRNSIKLLWIWRIGIGWDLDFKDEKKYGFFKGKRVWLVWYKKIAIGIGHAFGLD